MKLDEKLSYKLNHDTLTILGRVVANFPHMSSVIMKLKGISKELNEQVIKEISQ